jgi:hypothetical protein
MEKYIEKLSCVWNEFVVGEVYVSRICYVIEESYEL